MRTFLPSIRALKPLALAALTGAMLASAVPAQAQTVIVQGAPPPLRYEAVPVAPGPGYVWHHGHWYWNGYRYVWVPGRYYAGSSVVVIGGGYGYGHGYYHGHDYHGGYHGGDHGGNHGGHGGGGGGGDHHGH